MSVDAVWLFCSCSTTDSCTGRVRCDTGAGYCLEQGLSLCPALHFPRTSPAIASEALSTQPFLRPQCESAQGTDLGENKPAKHRAQEPVPAHLQKQRKLHKERDVEKFGEAQSQREHSDPLVTMCLSMNEVIPLSLSQKAWARV